MAHVNDTTRGRREVIPNLENNAFKVFLCLTIAFAREVYPTWQKGAVYNIYGIAFVVFGMLGIACYNQLKLNAGVIFSDIIYVGMSIFVVSTCEATMKSAGPVEYDLVQISLLLLGMLSLLDVF